jgi:hypothetical protein
LSAGYKSREASTTTHEVPFTVTASIYLLEGETQDGDLLASHLLEAGGEIEMS